MKTVEFILAATFGSVATIVALVGLFMLYFLSIVMGCGGEPPTRNLPPETTEEAPAEPSTEDQSSNTLISTLHAAVLA